MDPATTFCPRLACPARGQTGQGNIGIHSRKDKRFLCTACHKTFSATKGTALYRLRTATETVTRVVTLLAHGCPPHAIVAAFGFDERTVASWMARGGVHGQAVQEHLVEQPRDLGQVQADEIRGQRAAGHGPDPTADRAGEALCGTASSVGLYRWLLLLHPGHA